MTTRPRKSKFKCDPKYCYSKLTFSSDFGLHVDEHGLSGDGVDDVYPGVSRNTIIVSLLVMVALVGIVLLVKGVNWLMERRPRRRMAKDE